MAVFFDVVAFGNEIKKSADNSVLYQSLTEKPSVECSRVGLKNHYSKKIICFDYGTYKVGVAISDDDRNFAFPKEVIADKTNRDIKMVAEKIFLICKKYQSNVVVFGLPKNLQGATTERCDKIISIAKTLNDKFENSGEKITILLFDERFSTKATNAVMHTRLGVKNYTKTSRKNQTSGFDDAKSASVILHDVLQMIK